MNDSVSAISRNGPLDDEASVTEGLNDAQREAVLAPPQPLLVLAGAGSGKTRVLTHRIAMLLINEVAKAHQIMAVTFTNKAAREMRERIASLIGYASRSLYVGTFHSLSHRILRVHPQEAGLIPDFEVIAADDQKRLIKDIMQTDMEIVITEQNQPQKIQWRINELKDKGIRANRFGSTASTHDLELSAIYKEYEARCEQGGLVDFAELLLRVVELMENNAVVRERYQGQFRHILIDEYQDTNAMQFRWLQMFYDGSQGITAVGDDDQSIYGWRGARVENMYEFQSTFSDAQIIRLEQNYRSTKAILDAANNLISFNGSRLGKSLWTSGDDGVPIQKSRQFDEQQEAEYVANSVHDNYASGRHYDQIAVLYRTNAQSRIFEEIFAAHHIPYVVYGGFRFFERLEVRGIMAYLRLLVNPDSDNAFSRVINYPARGIGKAALTELRRVAKQENASLWSSASRAIADASTPKGLVNKLVNFVDLIKGLQSHLESKPLPELVALTIKRSGLKRHYSSSRSLENVSRVENLDELVNVAERYVDNTPFEDNSEIFAQFLADAALDAGDRQFSEGGHVQLMSLHSAKGLEFPVVYLTGMVEGVLPHWNALQHNGEEEERRLCYVGMTRAMEQLYLTSTLTRRIGANMNRSRPSRFLAELDC